MGDKLQKAAREVTDWAWMNPNGAVATIPWDLMWKLLDALEELQQGNENEKV